MIYRRSSRRRRSRRISSKPYKIGIIFCISLYSLHIIIFELQNTVKIFMELIINSIFAAESVILVGLIFLLFFLFAILILSGINLYRYDVESEINWRLDGKFFSISLISFTLCSLLAIVVSYDLLRISLINYPIDFTIPVPIFWARIGIVSIFGCSIVFTSFSSGFLLINRLTFIYQLGFFIVAIFNMIGMAIFFWN